MNPKLKSGLQCLLFMACALGGIIAVKLVVMWLF